MLWPSSYLFLILILKCTPMGHWPGNCPLIGCTISFRQLCSPVRTLLNLVRGPFSCGNLCITGFSTQCWYGFSEGNRQSTSGNKTINQNSLCCSAVTLVAVLGWWRSERGGVGESWLHNNFFSIYYSTSPVSRDGIAVAISASRKIALKMYVYDTISSRTVVVLVRGSSGRRGLWDCRTHFSSCKSGFPNFKKVVYSGTRPLFHCRTDPNALQCHRCLESFQLSHWSEVPCDLIWHWITNILHSYSS